MRIYKGWNMVFLMVKTQLQLQKLQLEKACFGTKEWSQNSGICNGCEQKDDCGKIKAKKGL
jgi:hypothetical protein